MLPEVISAADHPTEGDVGSVAVNFPRGSILLRGADETVYRLVWDEDGQEVTTDEDNQGTATRSLPPGHYRCIGYRILREVDGVPWHLSGTDPQIAQVHVRAGKTTTVKIDPVVDLKLTLRRHGRSVFLGSPVQGPSKCGLTVYRDGRRVAMHYQLERRVNGMVDVLTKGRFNYG